MTSPGETPNARLILRNRSSVASNSECQAGRAFSVEGPHTASANREWQLVILGSNTQAFVLSFGTSIVSPVCSTSAGTVF